MPRRIAPARRIRDTATASREGTTPTRSGMPAEVSTPAVSNTSFAVNGTPWSGPSSWPRAKDASAARASSMARSPARTTTALMVGLTSSIRRRNATTASADDTLR